jgi:hypothetical protein
MNPPEKARAGLGLLKEAVCDYLAQHPDGRTNADVARDLQLESDFQGQQKNYLSWSVLGLLVNEGKVRYDARSGRKLYCLAS